MRETNIHRVKMGALLWADNLLSDNGQGYKTVTKRLYPMVDNQLEAGYYSYSSPFKQWVCDSGVNGATVIRSVSGSGGVISAGQSGIKFDYNNGRVLLTGSANLNITGTFSFKDFNVYETNEDIEALVIENKYYLNSRFGRTQTGIQPYSIVTPCAFVNVSDSKNEQAAMGGLKDSRATISVVLMAENQWNLDAALDVFKDSKDKNFPAFDTALDPLNEYGDLKSGYNYDVMAAAAPMNDYIHIESVTTSKMDDKLKINENLYVGYVEINVSMFRTT